MDGAVVLSASLLGFHTSTATKGFIFILLGLPIQCKKVIFVSAAFWYF